MSEQNKYGLSPEDIERRRRAAASISAPGGAMDSMVVSWRRKGEGLLSTMDAIQHTEEYIKHYHQHVYHHRVQIPTRDDKPARTFTGTAYFTCWQSEEWHRILRMRKIMQSEPTCPACRLVYWLRDRQQWDATPVLRLGEGCVNEKGEREVMVEVTGRDFQGEAGGKYGWKKDYSAGQKRALAVIPLSINDKPVEPPAVKLIIEGYSMVEAYITAMASAKGRKYGDDADPVHSPAVYRWTNDRQDGKFGQASAHVEFLPEMIGCVPEAAVALWRSRLSEEVKASLADVVKRDDGRKYLAALREHLCVDVDLEAVTGVRAAQNGAPTGEQRPAEPAAPQGGGRRPSRRAAEEAPPPPAPPASKAEPCTGCGTPWPEGVYRCPGSQAKGCRMVDSEAKPDGGPAQAVPPAQAVAREPGSDDGGSEIPF